jgi:hypothetical protein
MFSKTEHGTATSRMYLLVACQQGRIGSLDRTQKYQRPAGAGLALRHYSTIRFILPGIIDVCGSVVSRLQWDDSDH